MCCIEATSGARAARAVMLLVAFALCGACSRTPEVAPQAAAPPPAPSPTTPAAPEHPSRLDAFGNLRGSGERVLGFEIPVGAERRAEGVQGPVYYVEANRERLMRYFRSRGHSLLERLSDLEIRHTGRTLRGSPDAPKEAVVRATPGPGPGWTLSFDKGEPTPLAKPALIELIDAERAFIAEGEDGEAEAAGGEAEAAARPGTDGEPLEDHQGTPGAPVAHAHGAGAPAVDRAALRRSALERHVAPERGRDLSKRIYEYVKAHPDRGFLD